MATNKTTVALLAAFATASAGRAPQAPTEERIPRRFPCTCPR
ncbi:MAG: hypothetical protein AABM64_01665 [Pseudomonadota bacterium]